jgi:putative ABC transport system substrate-binding protein
MIRRRDFIAGIGAAAWPLAARAQQRSMPVIGFLNSASPHEFAPFVDAFRLGLSEVGYTVGKNVAIEYLWAEGQYDRLPGLAADLVRRQVAVIAATGGLQSALAAKAATTQIPILFAIGIDPIEAGLVPNFGRPGGNVTGASIYSVDLIPKRLELLKELAPTISTIALLINATSQGADRGIKEMEMATRAAGLQLLVVKVRVESEFDAAFADAVRQGAGAILTTADSYLTARRVRIVDLAKKYSLPAIYPWREYVEAGGLMSYGPRITLAYHQIGNYAGRILNGVRPADLPVQALPRVELALNLKTVKALGLIVPRLMLARADEIIE